MEKESEQNAPAMDRWNKIADDLKAENPEDRFQHRIAEEAGRLRIRREAERHIREEDARLGFNPPQLLNRSALRDAAENLPKYRIDGLMLADSDFVLIGEKKSGKSTIALNMIRSLTDGGMFLGRFHTRPIDGNILMLNYELSTQILDEWMDAIGINSDKVITLSPRGYSNPLSSDYGREWLANECKKNEVEILLIDPFSVAFKGQGDENSNTAQREWLESLSDIRGRCDVREILVSIHAGKNAEREARGAGAIQDWAASYAQVYKDPRTKIRSLSAYGRDVDVDKFILEFDPETHRLTQQEQVKFSSLNNSEKSLLDRIVGAIAESGQSMNQTQIKSALGGGFDKSKISPVMKQAVEMGVLSVQQKGASLMYGLSADGGEDEPPRSAVGGHTL